MNIEWEPANWKRVQVDYVCAGGYVAELDMHVGGAIDSMLLEGLFNDGTYTSQENNASPMSGCVITGMELFE